MKLKRRTTYLFFTLTISLAALVITLQLSDRSQDIRDRAVSSDDPTISLTANPNPVWFGNPVDVSIVINNPAGKAIVGTDIVLNFDKNRLTLTNITPVTTHQLKTFTPLNASNIFDGSTSSPIVSSANSTGKIIFGAVGYNLSTNTVQSPQTSTFTLATLRFNAKPLAGSANLSFDAIINNTTDTNIAVQNIPADSLRAVTGLSITVSVQPTNTPIPTSTPLPTATPTPTSIPCPNGASGNLDCSLDGCIDTGDFELFRQAFGRTVSSLNIPNGHHTPDLLLDGSPIIDTGDFAIFSNNFASCQQST